MGTQGWKPIGEREFVLDELLLREAGNIIRVYAFGI